MFRHADVAMFVSCVHPVAVPLGALLWVVKCCLF